MQIQLKRVLLLAAAFGALASISLFGQTFGEVTGRISDPTGAAIPAAQITLTSVATNAVRNTISTDSGDYTFPAVAPGSYSVKVEKSAFKSATTTDVEVQIQQTVRLDFTLQVGQVSESVEVSASAQMLQSENVSLGNRHRKQTGHRTSFERAQLSGTGGFGFEHEYTFGHLRASGRTPGRRSRQSVDLRWRKPNHVRLLHAGRGQ